MEPRWQVVGASVQGTSHQRTEVPCQDAHGYRVLSDGLALVAVADGAGSAERSSEGARCAAEWVLAAVEAALQGAVPQEDAAWEKLLVEAFRQARQSLVELAEVEGLPCRAYATTLTCAIASAEELVIGQIGDGIVVVQGEDGELFTAVEPQRGEYANETLFLTMEDALQLVAVRVYRQPAGALAVMTDGLVRLAMNLAENRPHPPFFRPLFDFVTQIEDPAEAEKQLAALLASERVCARTDDDKTLVLVGRPPNVGLSDRAADEAGLSAKV